MDYRFQCYGGSTLTLEVTPSDERLKFNIENEYLGVDFIKSISWKTFEYKDNPGTVIHGPIAQDILPFITKPGDKTVDMTVDGFLNLDKIQLISIMGNAIKQLTLRVEALENK
jgi:hypothetical protein